MKNTRFEYLIKTLSRTKRKDYENYIVNAIWNRLNDSSIKPASQWFVKNQNGWHLIDLYFPQINLGVECDEGHHKSNQANDEQRELKLIEVLSAASKHPYQALHIDATLPFEDIELKINDCVRKIKMLVKERREANDFIEWSDVDTVTYFKDKQIIRSSDDILFPTIVSAVNSLMQSTKKGYQLGYFTPRGLDSKYKFWFPQLEVEGKAQARGWHNILSEDGKTITEYNDDIKANMVNWEGTSRKEFLDYIRVTFAKVRDPITNKRAYKFVGLFELKAIDDGDVRTYSKISDTFNASRYKLST
ncbi:restriction endonuclease [Candidatus Saccharibacteria bacterium]|nr:restriction endonuclease [Candidatus Saccharibacteria bacterium]